VEASPQGITTTRLQRRHLSSTPRGHKRASKLPHGQRLSLACTKEEGVDMVFIFDEIENHFQFHLSSVQDHQKKARQKVIAREKGKG
jgi:hypothetical protein